MEAEGRGGKAVRVSLEKRSDGAVSLQTASTPSPPPPASPQFRREKCNMPTERCGDQTASLRWRSLAIQVAAVGGCWGWLAVLVGILNDSKMSFVGPALLMKVF